MTVEGAEEIEPLQLLRNACSRLDSVSDEISVLRESLETACMMEGIDCAGVYGPESASGRYVLRACRDLPEWFLGSYSDLPAGSLPVLQVKKQGTPGVFQTGMYPMHPGSRPGSHLFTASLEPGRDTGSIHLYLHWLASAAGANLRRVRALDIFRRSLDRRTLLLDMIKDPVAALDRGLDLIYCNRAFRDLARLEESDGRDITFREAAGRELYQLMGGSLADAVSTGEPSGVTCIYHDRVFSTSVHPVPGGILVIMRDVTEEEAAMRRLHFRDKFESLLVSIATDFIEMQGTALNLGIHDALLNIGVAVEADRAYLFQFGSGQEVMSNTHEWCATNIQPHMDRLQDLRASDYPWLMNRLNMHETIHIHRVQDMPEWARAERELMIGKDVQSAVVVPIVHGNLLTGFLGFDSVNRERRWPEDTIDLLRIVGDAMGNALERGRMEKKMMRMYRRAEKEAQLNSVLLREVNHRVKNNLSEIIGFLYAQKRFSRGDYSEFIHSLTDRVRGLATVHDMLSRSGWKPLRLTGLARGIVEGAAAGAPEGKKLTVSVSKSSITVNSNQAHALALIMNELVRNSIKHALEDRDSLRIKVRMRKDRSGRVTLTYSDDGPGYPVEVISMERINLGLDLIRNLVFKNLQGKLTLLNDAGAAARIGFRIVPPLEGINEEE